nr:O-antigen ligase family protein [uncultured Blautia sp.]
MKTKKFYNIGVFYFIVTSIIFTTSIAGPDNEKINIMHLVLKNVTPTTIVSIIGLVIIVSSVIHKKFTLDLILMLLLARIPLVLITTLYIEEMPNFYGYLLTTLLCAISYYIARNCVDDPLKLKRIVLILYLWLCFQTMLESYLSPVSYFEDTYFYKNDLIIPIGGSNAIATRVIPCFAFCFCCYKNKWHKFLMTVVLFITLGLTKSRSGILAAIVVLAILLVWKGNINIKKICQMICVLFFSGLLLLFLISKTKVGQYVFYNNGSTIFNRLNRWDQAVDLFLKYPLFGTGYLSQAAEINPHNWIVSILARGGIIGCMLAIVILFLILSRLKGKYKNDIIRGSICFAVAMLIQGLAEITLFTSTHDFFFWFFIGLAMRQSRVVGEIGEDSCNTLKEPIG